MYLVLLLASFTSAVHLNFLPSSYIYRSDNNNPPTLINLGLHQPQNFIPSLPIAPHLHHYGLLPAPLPYISNKPISIQKENDGSDEVILNSDLIQGHEKGEGSDYGEQHSRIHGGETSKGYKSQNKHEDRRKGEYGKDHKEGYFVESGGNHNKNYDEADNYGSHYEKGNNYDGSDNGHKEYYSKGEDVTGYHKVYHKDEFKKKHNFYDVADKNGHFNKHGYEKKHHDSDTGGHKKGGNQEAGYNNKEHGETAAHENDYIDEAETENSNEESYDTAEKKEEEYSNTQGTSHRRIHGNKN